MDLRLLDSVSPVMKSYENALVPTLHDILTKCAVNEDENEDESYTLTKFERFLFESHCQENYEFWKCCNEYLSLYDYCDFDVEKWNSILYKRFIGENSPMECNLPGDIREDIRNSYCNKIKISEVILTRARQHAWSLMSGAYRQYVRKISKKNDGYSSNSGSRSRSVCISPLISSRIEYGTLSATPLTPEYDLPMLSADDTNTSTGSSGNLPSESSITYSASPLTKSRTFSSNLLRSFDREKRAYLGSSDAVGAGKFGLFTKGKELVNKLKSKNKHSSSIPQSSKFPF